MLTLVGVRAAIGMVVSTLAAVLVLVAWQSPMVGVNDAAAAQTVSGRWTASVERGDTTLHFAIRLRDGRMNTSRSLRMDEMRGISAAAIAGDGGDVAFQIVREAGSFNCEGWFKNGEGGGTLTFVPTPAFGADMRALGYDVDEDQLLACAMFDIGPALAGQYASIGYDRLGIDNLIAMTIHGATPDNIRELASLGYEHLSADDLVAMRVHGATPDFIREVERLGYKHIDAEELVAMRIHNVTPDFVRAFAALGYEQIATDDLVAMRIHDVRPEFVEELRGLGYEHVPVDELVAMRVHGLTGAFVRSTNAREGRNLSIDDLIDRRIRGER